VKEIERHEKVDFTEYSRNQFPFIAITYKVCIEALQGFNDFIHDA